MKILPVLKQILAALFLVGVIMAVYGVWARPSQLHWGASAEEWNRPMPGDELDTTPTFLATRAITIQGTPAEIWPWLLQMGYTRAGYYGFDLLENIGSPRGLASADRILPEFQQFQPGDKVPISSVAEEVFSAIQPNQYLIWAGETGPKPGGFTWALYPLDGKQTRLVSRIRWTHHALTQPGLFALDMFTEFSDHLAVRKILQGVKGHVEGSIEPAALVNAELGTYVFAALIFFAAVLLVLLRPFTWTRWMAGLAAGAGWLLVWYTPMPFWGGILVELLILIGLFQQH
jgi:hypothetical protein